MTFVIPDAGAKSQFRTDQADHSLSPALRRDGVAGAATGWGANEKGENG